MFTPEGQLPEGVGFAPFGPVHLWMLGLLAGISAPVVILGCRMGRENRIRLLKVLSGTMLVMEIIKTVTLGAIGAFSVGYLPLHLCSLALYLCLFFAWHPDSVTGGQLVWCVCLPAGLSALLFPDWTHMPIWHFQSLHSFLYHAMMVEIALIAVISGMARPRVGRTWRVMVFLTAAAAVIYPVDLALRTNYMFLLRPLAGTPLELCARLPGQAGYLLGFTLLAAAVTAALALPFTLWDAVLRRRTGTGKM